jgi:hypothetical protein
MYDRTHESEELLRERIRRIKESQAIGSGLTHDDLDKEFEQRLIQQALEQQVQVRETEVKDAQIQTEADKQHVIETIEQKVEEITKEDPTEKIPRLEELLKCFDDFKQHEENQTMILIFVKEKDPEDQNKVTPILMRVVYASQKVDVVRTIRIGETAIQQLLTEDEKDD